MALSPSEEHFESFRLECQCSSFQHSVRFSIDDEGEIYICTNLNTWLPWYKRLWQAIVYVFNPGSSKYGHYDEVILHMNDYNKIIEMLDKSRRIKNQSKLT